MSTLAAAERLVGATLGDYTLQRVLGVGGMGAVYQAVHRTIGRTAAIKVLHPELSGRPMVVQRFFNEARAVNMIRHPGIVDIIDYQPKSDHGAFLVMEYLEGESLERHMVRVRRIPLHEVSRLVRRIARPLQAAHDRDIVHRDLKPANIFLVPDPDHPREQRVKLLDFGIAKLGDSKPPGSLETSTGAVIGTPLYMSPEQCHGAKHIDHRTDIYALGVIAFEMLAGVPPFTGAGWGDIIVKHMREPPPSLRVADPSMPIKVDEVVARALAKEPEQRFTSIAELAEAFGSAAATKRETLPLSSAQMSAYRTGPPPRQDSAPAAAPAPPAPTPTPVAGLQAPPTEPPSTGPRQVSPRPIRPGPAVPQTRADAIARAATPPASHPIAAHPSMAAEHGEHSVPTVRPGPAVGDDDREASIPTVTPAGLADHISPEDASAPTIRPQPRRAGNDGAPTVIAGSGGSAGAPTHADGVVPETQVRAGAGAGTPQRIPTEKAAAVGVVPQTVMGHDSPDRAQSQAAALQTSADDWRKRTAGIGDTASISAGPGVGTGAPAPTNRAPLYIVLTLAVLGLGAFAVWFFAIRGKGAKLCAAADVAGCRKACAADHMRSCARLANALQTRGLDEKSATEAARAAERACHSGLGASCLVAAEIYDPAGGKLDDSKRAAELYARACSPARPRACKRRSELAGGGAKRTNGADGGAASVADGAPAAKADSKPAIPDKPAVDLAAVKAAALARRRALVACHRRSRLAAKTLAVAVSATLDRNGSAGALAVDVSPKPKPTAALQRCLLRVLRAVSFPKPAHGKPTPVRFSVTLKGHAFNVNAALRRARTLARRRDRTSLRSAQSLLRRVLRKRPTSSLWFEYGHISCRLRDCASGRRALIRLSGELSTRLIYFCQVSGCMN